ncbi:hypothetical protein GSI_05592 [Ganoderma sinense ZZ0214-1]|uniref:DUF4139 domain-containing protein n=1 Tax=Ganoderma sinense ZZ0214-1 TaxID=1077348 RepID=A0A2G8SF00_9APHY|nr:hypothetical protein GSI_05592 [Ganoderma sinense ZZ0214-1]
MSSKTVISLNASEHPVKAVTIFQSYTAQLTRTFEVDLKAGSNVLEITSISTQVDKESPRIYGLGTDVRVFDTSCSTKLAIGVHQDHTRNAAAIKELKLKRKLLKSERDVRQTEFTLLDDAARALAQDKAASFDTLIDTFVGRKRKAGRAVVEVDEEIEEIEKELWLLKHTHMGDTAAVVTATLLAKRDCKVEFQLTYLVTGVTWKPYYDLHATTSDGKPSPDVSLHYCANITQNTGEDWTNAVLTLSTADSQASHSLTIPKVDPLRILPARPPPATGPGGLSQAPLQQQLLGQYPLQQQPLGQQPLQQQQQQPQNHLQQLQQHAQMIRQIASDSVTVQQPVQSGFGQFINVARPLPSMAPPPAQVAPRPGARSQAFMVAAPAGSVQGIDEEFEDFDESISPEEIAAEFELPAEGAVLDASPLSLAYRVEGRVTLPSDGAAHKVAIATLAFGAALTYVCVPRKAGGVFIEGRIKNTSEYELLAGPVSVFMDDGFVSKTQLGLIGVNESFSCVLGIDTALKVVSQPKSRTEHEPKRSFAEPFKTTTRTVTTTIANGHPFDVAALVVRDAIPLGHDDANIKVVLRRPAGLAQAKDGEEVAVALPGMGTGAPGDGNAAGQGQGQEVKVRWVRTECGSGGEKAGLYEWVCGLKAGKRIKLEAEWEVKAPSNMRWEELRMGARSGTSKA